MNNELMMHVLMQCFGRDRKSHGTNTQNGYGFVGRRGSMTEIAKLGPRLYGLV